MCSSNDAEAARWFAQASAASAVIARDLLRRFLGSVSEQAHASLGSKSFNFIVAFKQQW